ncbi:MAG: ABC transporter substrate-binding protein [Chloroflexi bacterium]|nr:ABC transporter substrate-binding protein [Chloroflexota bacterium]
MASRLLSYKILFFIGIALALGAAFACGSSDEDDTVSAAPTPDIGALVRESVSAAISEAGTQPQGPSAAELQKLVETAVMSLSADQLSAQDVKSIVDAAVASQSQGATPAEVEAAIRSATSAQLSAADVQKIVEASVATSQGPTAAEIQRLVQSAVVSATAGQLSAADVKSIVDAAVASQVQGATAAEDEASIRAASENQLSAAEVQKIVDASLMATEEALMATEQAVTEVARTAERAQRAAEAAAQEAAAAAGRPQIKAATGGEFFSYKYDGPRPTTFQEAPILAELVRQGELPPLMERLPVEEDIRVVNVPEIGEFGGTYRITSNGLGGHEANLEQWVKRDGDGIAWYDFVGYFELSDDGRTYTMRLRDGLKWSDGVPLTMDQIRFAWEEVNLNKELNPRLGGMYEDLVSGNEVEFNIIDDLHFSLTYDSPNYALMTNRADRRGHFCGVCWFVADQYMKQFHPDHANAADLAKAITESGAENWTGLFSGKTNMHTNPEHPSIAPFQLDWWSDSRIHFVRNPYFFQVDPAGNQLPYVDAFTKIKVESRDVAVFRTMAGETDAYTRAFQLGDLPLLQANAENGGYQVFLWPSTGGNDVGLHMNMTYNTDPEIGKWIRTADFRKALSLGINREQINEVMFHGLGTIQAWIPHPETPYYPGAQWAGVDISHDPVTANRILDGLGLTSKDSEGYRLRADGMGPLTLSIAFPNDESAKIAPMVQQMWRDIGIKLALDSTSVYYQIMREDTGYMALHTDFSAYHADPWMIGWNRVTPVTTSAQIAAAIGLYFQTQGAEGMAPGPNSAFMPAAPPNNYAADPSGSLMMLQNIYVEGRKLPRFSPERVELGKQIFQTNVEEKYTLGTIGFTATRRGVMVNRKNFRNVPELHIRDKYGFWTETYYFENGIGNFEN